MDDDGRTTTGRKRRVLETLEGVRNAVCAAKKCLPTGRIKSREESIFKKEDVDRMFSESVGESVLACGSPLTSPPLSIGRHTFSAVHSRATKGGFDLWKPAGRFTNIKFAFKRVDPDAAEGGSHVCTLPDGFTG